MPPALAGRGRRTLVRATALLFPPLAVLGSAHELYLRNQQELHHCAEVLHPFWAAAGAAIAAGALLQRLDRHRMFAAALWAYYGAGLAFVLWVFLRGLPLGGGLAGWALDTGPGAALFALGCAGAGVAVARRRAPRSVEPALAVLALALAGREAVLLSVRERLPPPAVADIPASFPPVGEMPNVYHLLLDAFQEELFEPALPPGAEPLLGGFVRVRLESPMRHTMSVLPSILSGRWGGDSRYRLARTLTGEANVFGDLRRAGYRSVGFVPNFIYRASPPLLDLVVYLDDSVFLEGRDTRWLRSMHSALFRQLWAYSVLPPALVRPLAARNRLGLEPGTLRSVEALRLSALAQPVVSRLGMERFLETEPDLPARGRYTFVHLLLPHSPYVLRSDCSQGEARTDLEQQTRCTLRLLVRFLETLDGLGRLADSVIVIHGDHGSGYALRDGRLVADASGDRRTILLLKPAGALGPMRVAPRPARIVDIAPTLLALAGVTPERELDGRPVEDVLPGTR